MSRSSDELDAESPRRSRSDEAVGRFPWWEWSEDVLELRAPARPLARALARAVNGFSGEPESNPADLYEMSDVSLEEAWNCVSVLHRSLDRYRESAPEDEFVEARQRLDSVAGQLWSWGVESELRAVREFLGEVAHDFRSPLHSSLFLTGALFREESGSLTLAQKRQLSVVHSAVNALLRLANDLLDFSKSDAATPGDEPVDIPFSPEQLVKEIEDLLEPIIYHRGVALNAQVEITGVRIGDPQVLHRVLLNLVSNALEAVEEGGTVSVAMTGDEDHMTVAIENSAEEVSETEMRQLLTSGDYSSVVHRLGGHTRGLGLVISGRLIRLVDGAIEVERGEDGVMRVSVTVPFRELQDKA